MIYYYFTFLQALVKQMDTKGCRGLEAHLTMYCMLYQKVSRNVSFMRLADKGYKTHKIAGLIL